MKRKSHAPVPPTEDVVSQTQTRQASSTNRRKSVARKGNTFDSLEKESSSENESRPAHIIDYQLMINNIAVFDLEDTGTRFDEQDPLVSIKIGEAKAETERQEDAGTNANFSESFVFDLTEEDAGGECGKDTMVAVDLVFKSKKGEKPQGRLTMRCQLVDMRPSEGGGCCVVS